MFIGTFLTALLLMIDEIALMVDRLAPAAERDLQREKRILWAVVRGGAVNYVIAIPLVLLAGSVAPWLVGPVLAVGGLYLCLEAARQAALRGWIGPGPGPGIGIGVKHLPPQPDMAAPVPFDEQAVIRGALRVDLVVSFEITLVALGDVLGEPFWVRALVLTGVAAMALVGVYGTAALILKLAGPSVTRFIRVAGVVAACFIGGGLIVAGIPQAEALLEAALGRAAVWLGAGAALVWLAGLLAETVLGFLIGVSALRLAALARIG